MTEEVRLNDGVLAEEIRVVDHYSASGRLAGARISVAAVQAVCGGGGSYGTIVFLPPAAVRKAASVLGST
jgi:hypothetical protein